ncbi:hypothetical protein FKW77_010463 [Venturia effusa]|uniref:HRDC domain-containing protein n=1 Tax=Venturia effusa TaxID=50376 RepID=A0A517L2F9_9PEZI|nr:hypothetical protein FKW77_010463 [Venturia effusa]
MENTGSHQPLETRLTSEPVARLSYKEYRNPGGECIPLYYCASPEAAEHGGQQLLIALEHNELQVVGVDGIGFGEEKSGVSLSSIQFTALGPRGCIVIIHLPRPEPFGPEGSLPTSIRCLLSSTKVLKVGHGVVDLGDYIHKYFRVQGHSFYDLGHTHSRIQEKSICHLDDNTWFGLNQLVLSYLGRRLDREAEEMTIPMTDKLVDYAASRSLAVALIFEAMFNFQELPPPYKAISTDPRRHPVVGLPIHSENVHIFTVEEIEAAAKRKQDLHRRERGRKDRRHQAEYDELNLDSQDLYKSLMIVRDRILESTGLPPHKVSDTKNIYLLALKKPTTVEALKEIKLRIKATQGQYAYDFVNVVRLHLGLEVLVEPLQYQRECREEQDAAMLAKQMNGLRNGGVSPAQKVTTVRF